MADLESLVEVSYLTLQTGKAVSEISDEELEQLVMTGRLAREAEAEGARAKRAGGKKGTGAKKKTGLDAIPDLDFDLDLDDLDDLD